MRISTDRLVLREFTADDWADVLAYQRDSRYLRFGASSHRTETEVRESVRKFVGWQREEPRRRFHLAVMLRDGGQLIGACSIRRKVGSETEADIGYDLAPEQLVRTASKILRIASEAFAPGSGDWIGDRAADHLGLDDPQRRLLEAALIVCADHELNVSAFAARCAASAGRPARSSTSLSAKVTSSA